MGIVSLVRAQDSKEDIRKSVTNALDLIDFKPRKTTNSIVIKANLCYYWNAATGYTTDPRLVEGIIDNLRETYGKDIHIQIAEADASAMRTQHAFVMLGYDRLAKEKDVELVNLSAGQRENKKVTVNGHEFQFEVPKLLLDSDFFISAPKLKTMRETRITCALKNVFGCIATPRKAVFHPMLPEAIVAINKILHPHLTIVDGMVALGSQPMKLGLIMASEDPFSVDWIASQILGHKPSKVEFLRIAMKEGLGSSSIITKGEDVSSFKGILPKPGFSSSKLWWAVQFFLLKSYNKIAGDVVPPDLEGVLNH